MTPKWTQREMAKVAAEERAALGLNLMDPLDPYLLAETWGIPVYPISDLCDHGCPSETIAHFRTTNSKRWSAALIPFGSARIIIENDSHQLVRRRSSVAHEISHHILEHAFPRDVLSSDHDQLYSKTLEKQALYMSAELLAPTEACRKLAFRDADNATVASQFNISVQMAQMQMKGPRTYARYALAKQASSRRTRAS
jgi:Zn-dependent peptidase ImmA (M78 family)